MILDILRLIMVRIAVAMTRSYLTKQKACSAIGDGIRQTQRGAAAAHHGGAEGGAGRGGRRGASWRLLRVSSAWSHSR